MGDDDKKSIFITLPGILTGLAALIGALTTLYITLQDGQTQLAGNEAPKKQAELNQEQITDLIKQQTEKACSSFDFRHTEDFNQSFIEFNLPRANHGTNKTWIDGYHTQYKFPTCRGIGWKNIKFTCNNGDWILDSPAKFYSNALCHGSNNNAQKGIILGVE